MIVVGLAALKGLDRAQRTVATITTATLALCNALPLSRHGSPFRAADPVAVVPLSADWGDRRRD